MVHMQFPVHVSFHDFEICDAIEALCWEQAGTLEPWGDRIEVCRVRIERPAPRDEERPSLRVQLELCLADRCLRVDHESSPWLDDPGLAVRDVFSTARSRLRAMNGTLVPLASRCVCATRDDAARALATR
jgi:hypothetical protein